MADNELEAREGNSLTESIPITQLVSQMTLIQEAMRKVMIKDVHYGTVPGCGDKPTLLKPGAEKLELMFRLAPHCDDMGGKVLTTDLPNGHKNFEVHTAIVHIPTGKVWAVGVGMCSTMETKYRYRNAARKCPYCGKETIIKGKEEYGGGWLCWQKKGGCAATFTDDDKRITDQQAGRIEHDNPADYYNTCLKIGKKRSQVDGILSATAASDIFTQDLEDLKANGVIADAEVIETKTEKKPSTEKPAETPETKPPETTTRDAWITQAATVIGNEEKPVTDYCIATKKLQKGQTWRDLPESALETIVKSGKGFMRAVNNYFDGK
jgi:hypothetical protein